MSDGRLDASGVSASWLVLLSLSRWHGDVFRTHSFLVLMLLISGQHVLKVPSAMW